jgi:hypothetical protein
MQTTRAALVMAMGVVLLVGRVAAAEPAVELEMNIAGRAGTGMAGSGGGGLIGVPLGQRTVLMTGLELSGYGNDQSSGWSVSVPLQLKVYIRAPAERRLVPVLRLGGGYSRWSTSNSVSDLVTGETWRFDETSHHLQAGGSLGVVYFITRQLGLGMDAGVVYDRRIGGDTKGSLLSSSSIDWSVAARWGASLVVRL